MDFQIRTSSADETQALGSRLAALLFPGAVVGLNGDLGAGKTCFVKGLAVGLGIDADEVLSPTFTLIAEHCSGDTPLYHIDLYRLEGADVEETGMEEYLFGAGIAAIEWCRFLPAGMVNEYLLISFSQLEAETRVLTFTPHGERYEQVVQALKEGEGEMDK